MISPLLRPREKGRRYGRRLVPDENGVIHHPDGREVCDTKTAKGREEYGRRKLAMFERQGGMCSLCKPSHRLDFGTATFEHSDGRGSGGKHRDDRITKDGKPYNSLACWWANMEKGSRRP